MPTHTEPAPAVVHDRLLSLDVLRGLTIAGMVLVTDPGSYTHVYRQLTHAPWNDPTATDLIFPCFLVMVGISMTISFASRLRRGASRAILLRHALRRSVLLVSLGLLINCFWIYVQGTWRIPGILQRIGICYLFASALYLAVSGPTISPVTRRVTLGVAAIGLLATYWLLLELYPTPNFGPGRLDPLGNIASVFDRAVLTTPRMFQYGIRTPNGGVTFDPEGILSTLGALATVLFGALAGEEFGSRHTRAQRCGVLASAGSALWLLSLALRPFMPLNKQLYTPTFALWSTGLSLVVFAGLLWLIDLRGFRRGWTFLLIFGTNAIFAFFFPGRYRVAYQVEGSRPTPADL